MSNSLSLIIIDGQALNNIQMSNLKEFNREHHYTTIVVVNNDGYSKRFKLDSIIAETFIANIPSQYIIKR
jgi:hypothetical protein